MTTGTGNDNIGAMRSDQSSLMRLFDDTRKRLVETGTRNRLVHVNRSNARGKVINIVNERSDDVYAILATGKAMRFLGISRDKDDIRETVRLADVGEAGFEADRYTDAQLETRMGPDALQKRLLSIAHEAQTAEEESGVNILYLALGFLSWFEDKASKMPRTAPLVLLPVELLRNQRTSTYDVRLREEDIVTNLPLQQRLLDDFGIKLPEIEVDDSWSPSAYFQQIESLVRNNANWEVDQDGMQLGFFSFSKLLMYRDLALEAWPDGAIAHHDLTRGLLYEGFDAEPPLMGAGERLDDILPPEKIFHVVDADASQALVIEEARLGRNLVVQGPPGTGKSQTITNIIAAAVKEGKRVLFVAEKMAALSVVHDRLVKVGLQDICLELHSRNANKKSVLAELARTINAAAAVPSMPNSPTALTEARDKLNLLAAELHKPFGDTGETAFSSLSLQSKYIGLGVPPPITDGHSLGNMPAEQVNQLLDIIGRYGDVLGSEGAPESHPFAGVQNLELQPVDLARLAKMLEAASAHARAMTAALGKAISTLGVELPLTVASGTPVRDVLARLGGLPQDAGPTAKLMFREPNVARLREALQAGAKWRAARNAAHGTFIEASFGTSPFVLRGPIAAGTQSLFARWGSAYRHASRELAGMLRDSLPKNAKDRLDLIDQLIEIELRKAEWKVDESYCANSLGDLWRSDLTDFARLLPIVAWCENVRAAQLSCTAETLVEIANQGDLALELVAEIDEVEPKATRALNELSTC